MPRFASQNFQKALCVVHNGQQRAFSKYLIEKKGEHRDMLTLRPALLDQYISSYLLDLKVTKKINGEKVQTNPETTTLGNYFSMLCKYFELNDYPEDIINSENFKMCSNLVKSRKKDLTEQGKGNLPNRARLIEDKEEDKLWETGAFGDSNPESLLHAVFYTTSMALGFRAKHEATQLELGDFEVVREESGDIKWIQWSERATKRRHGENPDAEAQVRPFKPKIFPSSSNLSKCPVRLFMLYLSKRPETQQTPNSKFYLAINCNRPNQDSKWYKASNMGRDRIGDIMKRAAKTAGLSNCNQISNHSIRRTMVTRLNSSKIPHVLIAQLSGHKNAASLGRYICASIDDQHEMNAILQREARSYAAYPPALPPVPPSPLALHPAPAALPSSHGPLPATQPILALQPSQRPQHTTPPPLLALPPSQHQVPQDQAIVTNRHEQYNTISQFELQGLFSGASNITINNLNINLYKK